MKQTKNTNKRKELFKYSLVIVFGAILVVALIVWKRNVNPVLITVNGVIIDAAINKPYKEGGLSVSLSEGDYEVNVDDEGEFVLENVQSDAEVVLSGSVLFEDIHISLEGRNEVSIVIDSSMEKFLVELGGLFQFRQLRKLYTLSSGSYQGLITEDEFLQEENKFYDELLLSGDSVCVIKDVSFENRVKRGEGVSLDLVLYFNSECPTHSSERGINIKKEEQFWSWSPVDIMLQ